MRSTELLPASCLLLTRLHSVWAGVTPRAAIADRGGSARIMKYLISLIAFMAASSLVVADGIGTLVERLSKSHTWTNGGYPKLDTPKNASAKNVIAAYCKMSSFQDGSRIREFTVLEERTVKISGPLPDSYIAARCKTDHGAMIFLLQYKEKPGLWWVKQYDAPAEQDGGGQPATRPVSK